MYSIAIKLMHRRTIKQIYTRKTILKSYTTTTEGTGF